ncbi:MAG: hypothetical protein ACOH5I_02870 [Oligoflexus sp.]
MPQLNLQRPRPSLQGIFRLRCPYCLSESLLKDKSWFEFKHGCSKCRYVYERETGYFWGAPWMVNYPLTGIVTLILLVAIYRSDLEIHVLATASIVSIAAISFAMLFYPFARAIWLVADHWLHPLCENDAWSPKNGKS